MTDVTVSEVARQVQAAMTRLEGLAGRIENSFVSSKVFDLFVQGVAERDKAQDRALESKIGQSEFEDLKKRVADLEDDRKWLIRIVGGFVILGVLAAYFATGGGIPR